MHSFIAGSWLVVVVGVGLGGRGVDARALPLAATPVVTEAPTISHIDIARRQQAPDAISLAQVLLTAVPQSLRQIAATNIPAASSILNEQFLDDDKPAWFQELPWEIQVYLVQQFGPATAIPPAFPTAIPSGLESIFPSVTEGLSSLPVETVAPSQTRDSETEVPTETSALPTESSAPSTETSTSQSSEATSSTSESSESATQTESSSASTATSTTASETSTGTAESSGSTSSSTQPTSTTPPAPVADPQSSSTGLTRSQKIGLGVGIPLGLLAVAGLLACCFLLRRRRQRKEIDGSIPPSSPGFIPRFAFQEKDAIPYPQEPHQRLIDPNSNASTSFSDLHNMNWESEDIIDTSSSGESVPTQATLDHINNLSYQGAGPVVMAPALFHTHSSNRARGKRTSYTSLHSVAEVTEPDDDAHTYIAESPVLPRNSPPRHSPLRTSPKRFSPPRGSMAAPPAIPVPIVGSSSSIKRKPVGSSNSRTPSPKTANMANQSLIHPAMRQNGTAAPVRPRLATHHENPYTQSPYVSPIEERNPLVAHTFCTHPNHCSDPFNYEEDYGPEYTNTFNPHNPHNTHNTYNPYRLNNNQNNGYNTFQPASTTNPNAYVDMADGLYGGNTSLSRYPQSNSPPKTSKTEWPLRNFSIGGGLSGGHAGGGRRKSSPLWDRVYESP